MMRVFVACVLCGFNALSAAQTPMSAAEQAVFAQAHLRALKPPTTLHYRYEQRVSARPEESFTDHVTLQLRAATAGACCAVQGEFLSGERRLMLPEVDDAAANPVTMFFLEREVRELQRITRGQAAHFRRRIRLALAEAAAPQPVVIRHAGREIVGQEIVITPYLNDPMRNRFEAWAQRRYRFVLVSEVPGQVWQIEAELPGQRVDTLTWTEKLP
jgi:hypothetical protein